MFFDRTAGIKTLYYLITVDGVVTDEEKKQLEEIARLIDPDLQDMTEITQECDAVIQSIENDDEWYEIIQEAIDRAVMSASDDLRLRVPTRMIVWNMLVLSYADDDYDSRERKLMRHVCRFMDMDMNVFREMEILIKTDRDVEKELRWLNDSNRPYAEIRPIVDEIENRHKNIKASAQALIEDEVLFMEKYVEQEPSKLEQAKDVVVDKSKEVTAAVGEKGKQAGIAVGEKGKQLVGVVSRKSSKLLSNILDKCEKEGE